MLKTLFLDFDGTLLDSEPAWQQAPLRLLRARGLPVPEALRRAGGALSMREEIDCLLGDAETRRALGMTGEECLQWCFNDMWPRYRSELPFKPGAQGLVACAHARGLIVTIVTASRREAVEAACARAGIAPLLREIHSTFGVAEKKSAPELFRRLAARYGVSPRACALLDDAPYALIGARAAGCGAWAIAERTRGGQREEIRRLADRYFETLDEVRSALREMPYGD